MTRNILGRGLAVTFHMKFGEMRWKQLIFSAYFLHFFAVNAVNRGELFFSPCSKFSYKNWISSSSYSIAQTVTYFSAISYVFKIDSVNVVKQRRWIFVRNGVKLAVNNCKKCGDMRWIIFSLRIHHNSYKHSPHSPHFLQNFTQKPRPGSTADSTCQNCFGE